MRAAKGMVINMPIEVINEIYEAEEKAKAAKAEALALSKRLIAEAEESGKQAVISAKKKAEDEIRELWHKAGDKAKDEALELSRNTENRKATMNVKADSRLNKAVGFVIERIVNG
jgi:vacuolar-type H+-ATPase subunit H